MSTVLDMTGGENGSTSADKMNYCISNRFLENQPYEICSHLTEKASKAGFLNKPENGSKITVTKEKEDKNKERRRRSGKEKKKKNLLKPFKDIFKIVVLKSSSANAF